MSRNNPTHLIRYFDPGSIVSTPMPSLSVYSLTEFYFHLKGYLPPSIDRRQSTLERKREEYFNFVSQYYPTRFDELNQETYRQVSEVIDVLLACVATGIFERGGCQAIPLQY